MSKKADELFVKKIDKRFKTIFFIGLGLLLIVHVFYFIDIPKFMLFIAIFEIGLWTWFYMDCEMLQFRKYYIYCLLISVVFLGYALFLKQNTNFEAVDLVFGALFPLCFLLIHKSAGLIFVFLLKREPVDEKPAQSVADFVYMTVRPLGTIIAACVIFHLVK